MGRNGSYNQIHHHRNLSTSSTTTTNSTITTTFLPLLCRISAKDVAEIPQTSPCHKKNEPSSPKVSCMGQIKRHNNNNKINPTTTTTGKIRYAQLKKIFSGRNLLITTNTNTSSCVRSSYCKGCQPKSHVDEIKKNYNTRLKTEGGEHRRTKSENCGVVVPLNLAELDPPLPVVKLTCQEERGSLWKRRGGASPLGGLQIQQIQLPVNNNICLLITPPSVS